MKHKTRVYVLRHAYVWTGDREIGDWGCRWKEEGYVVWSFLLPFLGLTRRVWRVLDPSLAGGRDGRSGWRLVLVHVGAFRLCCLCTHVHPHILHRRIHTFYVLGGLLSEKRLGLACRGKWCCRARFLCWTGFVRYAWYVCWDTGASDITEGTWWPCRMRA